MSNNTPEDSYFKDVSEEFTEKIIETLESKFSLIKEKLKKQEIDFKFLGE